MKNNVRAHRHDGKTSTSAQVQTEAAKRPEFSANNDPRHEEPRFGWPHELDCARQQAHALTTLIYEALHGQEGEYCEDTQCGIIELMMATDRRLDNAVEAVNSILDNIKQAQAS